MSRSDIPQLIQFRLEPQDNGLVHLVFDCPDRSMNVFSNKAIHELGEIAEWLHASSPRGLLVRSGKANGFCAGADLTELGVAYEMIVAARPADRFDIAFGHFFPLSHALRRLETAGVPISAAIGGVALGGGCELALAAHHRVLADAPAAMLGLPECQVGLLPGAGGTQRMPRLAGVGTGLEMLLQGRTLAGTDAVEAGVADTVVPAGDEVAAAEQWLLSNAAHATQRWDVSGHRPPRHAEYADEIERHRERELDRMLGHEPAPLAILDCVELGLMQPMDGAIRAEMSVFARLIARPEPRNMIRTLFLGKQAYEKAARKEAVPASVTAQACEVGALVAEAMSREPGLRQALFGEPSGARAQGEVGDRLWLEGQEALLGAMQPVMRYARGAVAEMKDQELLQLDHLVVREGHVPAYLGGISGLATLAG